MFLSVVWDVDPVMFSIGSVEIRYYGLAWVLTFVIGFLLFIHFVKREGLPEKVSDSIFWWGILSTIIGARLGHCLFYDPAYFLARPWEIITGFRDGGLASHGAAIGLLVGLYFFSRRNHLPYVWSLDRIMMPVTIGGAFVRLGNLMNSEIYGDPTTKPWGFIFVNRGETIPMHPTQIYEAICYALTFVVLCWMYWGKDYGRRRPGIMFGFSLVCVFLSRFFIEFIKHPQEEFESGWLLDMGQWLSIPFIILGVWAIVRAYSKPATETSSTTKAGSKTSREEALANVKKVSKKK